MQQIFGDAANASNGSTLRTITTAYNAASLRDRMERRRGHEIKAALFGAC
jgi:hypothetical protein